MSRRLHSALFSAGVCLLGSLVAAAHAQDITSLSGGLTQSSNSAGFDGSYAEGAGSIGSNLQQGTTDTTGSLVSNTVERDAPGELGTALYDGSRYEQGTMTGAVVGSEGGGQGHLDASRAAFTAGAGMYQTGGFGASALTSTGNSNLDMRAGREVTDAGPAAAPESAAYGGGSGSGGSSQAATDPVYASLGIETSPDLELGAAPASPSAQVAAMYPVQSALQPQYAFDDGRTPLPALPVPGSLLPLTVESAASSTGFSDSTRGLAGLPTESQVFGGPAGLVRSTPGASPFADVSGGSVFGVHAGLAPTLHVDQAASASNNAASDEATYAYEQRLFDKRIADGISVSRAQWLRRQDLLRMERRSTLDQTADDLAKMPADAVKEKTIR